MSIDEELAQLNFEDALRLLKKEITMHKEEIAERDTRTDRLISYIDHLGTLIKQEKFSEARNLVREQFKIIDDILYDRPIPHFLFF
jgi:hypothetical protein